MWFKSEWVVQYDFVRKSEKDENYVYCKVCKSDFNGKGNGHVVNAKSVNATVKLTSVLTPSQLTM